MFHKSSIGDMFVCILVPFSLLLLRLLIAHTSQSGICCISPFFQFSLWLHLLYSCFAWDIVLSLPDGLIINFVQHCSVVAFLTSCWCLFANTRPLFYCCFPKIIRLVTHHPLYPSIQFDYQFCFCWWGLLLLLLL